MVESCQAKPSSRKSWQTRPTQSTIQPSAWMVERELVGRSNSCRVHKMQYQLNLGNSTNCRIIFIVQEPGMGRSLGRRSKHSRASGCAGGSDPFYKDEKTIPMLVSKISHLDHIIGLEGEEDGSKVGFLGETKVPRKHHVEPSVEI